MKKLIAMVMAMAMILSLAACGGSGGTADGGAASAAPGTDAPSTSADGGAEDEYKVFNYGTDANSTTFDPTTDLATNSGNFLKQAVGEALWDVDAEGNIKYGLAESLEYADDNSKMTIHVRQGVKFSNGTDMTAADVLFTLQRCASQPRTASMYASMDLANATCPDDYTVEIPLNGYDAALMDVLSGSNGSIILSKAICDGDYDYSWLIGTGPYMLKGDGESDKSGWEESVKYTLVRNPYYWGEEPYYDEFDVYFYSEESTRYADFQAGNLDAAYLTESTYVNNLANGAVNGAELVQVEESAVYGFEMAASDATNGSMLDINVRKAFAHALDIPTMVDTLGEGVYKQANALVGEGCWAYTDMGGYEYDPEAAKAYLAEAGYSVDNPLTIKVYAESTAWYSALFEAAQSYESAVGINLDLSGVADFGTILPILLSGQQDMSIGTASNGSGNDPANLLQQFGPASDNILLRSTLPDQVDLFQRGSASSDRTERTEIYKQFMQGVYDNYLFVPVCVGTKNFAVRSEHTSVAGAIDTSNQIDPVLLTD